MADIAIEKKSYAYDAECYPNVLCFTFIHVSSDDLKAFVIYADQKDNKHSINDYRELIYFVRNEVRTLIGYNSHEYDDVLLKHLMISFDVFKDASAADICKSCKLLSDKYFEIQRIKKLPKRDQKEHKHKLRNQYMESLKAKHLFGSLDLLLLFNTVERTGLKQIAINLRWPEIIDLPIEPSSIVGKDDIPDLLYYNKNDVLITKALLKKQEKEIMLRKDYGEQQKINVINASRTNIAKAVIRKYYTEVTGKKFDDFKNKRSHYKSIDLGQCISKKITFMSAPYQEAFNKFRNTDIDPKKIDKDEPPRQWTVEEINEILANHGEIPKPDSTVEKKQFEYILRSKRMYHTLGIGGIHSINKPGIISSNGIGSLWDIDVQSYYPFILANEGFYPAHLGPEFIKVYRKYIIEPRIEAKNSGNKTLAEILKIALNATFGLTKSIHSWMYDPKVTMSITVTGQLYLMMLMERLELYTKCEVIYSNTDGITVRVPPGEEVAFRSICKQWEMYTNLTLEYSEVKKIVIKDVNNFMIFFQDETKDLKGKGIFLVEKELKSGYVYPVLSKALFEWCNNDTNPELFIKRHTDIYDFMGAVKTSQDKFQVTHRSLNHEKVTTLKKSNRWIVTRGNIDEGKLIKYSYEKKMDIDMQRNRMVTLMNDMKGASTNAGDYKLDYDFYIQELYKIIKFLKENDGTQVVTKQAKLF